MAKPNSKFKSEDKARETPVLQGFSRYKQQTPPRNEMGFIVSTVVDDVPQVPQNDTMARKVRGGCILG